MEMRLREQVEYMQEVTKKYEIFHSIYMQLIDKISKSDDLLKQYNIKDLSKNKNETELNFRIIGKIFGIQFSITPGEYPSAELGMIKIFEIINEDEEFIANIYFDHNTLFSDKRCQNSVCDIENTYIDQRFLFLLMDNIFRYLNFIK